jgi:hypothetical protein
LTVLFDDKKSKGPIWLLITRFSSAIPKTDRLSIPTLESYLRKASGLVWGSIDVADYKNYKFRLPVLKRINGRYEEETEKTAEEYDIDEETVPSDTTFIWFRSVQRVLSGRVTRYNYLTG